MTTQPTEQADSSGSNACYDADDASQVAIYTQELRLLRRVAETSFNLLLARLDSGFCAINGGMKTLEAEHTEATRNHQSWLSDFDSAFD